MTSHKTLNIGDQVLVKNSVYSKTHKIAEKVGNITKILAPYFWVKLEASQGVWALLASEIEKDNAPYIE